MVAALAVWELPRYLYESCNSGCVVVVPAVLREYAFVSESTKVQSLGAIVNMQTSSYLHLSMEKLK